LRSSVRCANAAKTVKKQESTSSGNKRKNADAESKEGSSDKEEDDAIEAELGIAAQAEAETERMVAEISENEIVGRGMISLFTPILLRVVCLLGTVVAALVDLLHTYDHMATLVDELCTMVNERPTNVLATKLLREIGRLDTWLDTSRHGGLTQSQSDANLGNKASRIKNVAPIVSELAAVRPRVVLANMSLLLLHLDSEPYVLMSAMRMM